MTNCKSLIEDLSKYSIDGLEFLEAKPELSIFYINVHEGNIHHAAVSITITPRHIEIGTAERLSEKRGIVSKILKLIACKAVELNLPVIFRAAPGFMRRDNISNNGNRLFKYYNNLGFTRKNGNYYNTSVRNLKKIIGKTRKR
jgi:hypothetical protein